VSTMSGDALRVFRSRRPAARAASCPPREARAWSASRWASARRGDSYSNPKVCRNSPTLRAVALAGAQIGVHYKRLRQPASARACARGSRRRYGANEISLLVSASESHSQRNLNRSRADQWRTSKTWRARHGPFRLIGTVSVAFVPVRRQGGSGVVAADVSDSTSWGRARRARDTIGSATPHSVRSIFQRVNTRAIGISTTRAHGLVNYVRRMKPACAGTTAPSAASRPSGEAEVREGHTGNVATKIGQPVRVDGHIHRIDLDADGDREFCERTLGRELYAGGAQRPQSAAAALKARFVHVHSMRLAPARRRWSRVVAPTGAWATAQLPLDATEARHMAEWARAAGGAAAV